MASLKNYIKTAFDYDVTGLASYVDEQSDELIVKQVTQGKTLENITIQEGVKGSSELKLMNDTLTYQAGDCTMTASGDTVFTDRAISVETLGFLKEFCQKDLDGYWTQLNLRAGAMDEDKEIIFESAITDYIMELHSNWLDKLIWRGNKATGSGNLALMNGFRQFLTTGNGCVDLNTSATASITNANAYDVFYECYTNTPEEVAESADLVCFTGRENFNKLMKNLVDDNFFHYSPETLATIDTIVVPGTSMTVRKVVGLNTLDNIYTGRASQFIFGTDLTGDLDTYEMWYSQDDDVVKLRSKFRCGVQVPYLDQIGVWNGTGSPN
jgi:hypothetical protein